MIKSIAEFVDYDYSGGIDNEAYTDENARITRSLKGALVEGRAVCYGYSLALKYALNYFGIESEMIKGKTHAWNQVKIDGKWYNVDLTWSYENIRNILEYASILKLGMTERIDQYKRDIAEGRKNISLDNCLVSDELFYKSKYHTPESNLYVSKCPISFDQDKIIETLLELPKTELDRKIKDSKEILKELIQGTTPSDLNKAKEYLGEGKEPKNLVKKVKYGIRN